MSKEDNVDYLTHFPWGNAPRPYRPRPPKPRPFGSVTRYIGDQPIYETCRRTDEEAMLYIEHNLHVMLPQNSSPQAGEQETDSPKHISHTQHPLPGLKPRE